MKGFVAEYVSVDLNTLINPGTFCLTNNPGQVSTNHDPSAITSDYYTATLTVTADVEGRVTQILSRTKPDYSIETYIRTSGRSGYGWTNWARNDAFGCSTAADLASLLGVVGSGAAPNDANNLTKAGIYGVYGGTLNAYVGAGTMIVAVKGPYIEQSQIWSDGSKANVAHRTFDGSNWSAWVS